MAEAWECCGSGFGAILGLLAGLSPAQRSATVTARVVDFLLANISRYMSTCNRKQRSATYHRAMLVAAHKASSLCRCRAVAGGCPGTVPVLSWSSACLSSGLFNTLPISASAVRCVRPFAISMLPADVSAPYLQASCDVYDTVAAVGQTSVACHRTRL